jgi:hypothetical protein
MPNWSNSSITISINPYAKLTQAEKQVRWEVWKDLRNVLEKWDADGRDGNNSPDVFQIIHPRPKEEDDNWYEWNNENWGTKWDMRVYGFSFIEDELSFRGETAWNAPIGILNKLVSLGFNLKHLFASMENDDWGYHIDRNENDIRVVKDHYGYTHRIGDDDLEDFHENQWNAEDLTELERDKLAILYTLTGEFRLDIPEGLDEDDIQYFRNELFMVTDENLESIRLFIQNSPDEPNEEFKELRTEIMETLDDLKDKGYVNDGFYLRWCDELKGVQRGDMDRLQGISEFINSVFDERHDMIQYYTDTQAKEEPNLIKMYEVF